MLLVCVGSTSPYSFSVERGGNAGLFSSVVARSGSTGDLLVSRPRDCFGDRTCSLLGHGLETRLTEEYNEHLKLEHSPSIPAAPGRECCL